MDNDAAGCDFSNTKQPTSPPSAWSDEPPTQSGYYFWRAGHEDHHDELYRVVFKPDGKLYWKSWDCNDDRMQEYPLINRNDAGQWQYLGPLEPRQ